MKTQELISIAVYAGCEVIEYDNHYCLRKDFSANIVITVPKVSDLVVQLVEKIKELLGI